LFHISLESVTTPPGTYLLEQLHLSQERAEALWVKDKIRSLREHQGVNYENIAILYRTNLQVWKVGLF
jgi:superfamily I DNA/RNA helicase